MRVPQSRSPYNLADISDLIGRVQIPVSELMQEPNKMIRREDSLMGFEDANDMPGELL